MADSRALTKQKRKALNAAFLCFFICSSSCFADDPLSAARKAIGHYFSFRGIHDIGMSYGEPATFLRQFGDKKAISMTLPRDVAALDLEIADYLQDNAEWPSTLSVDLQLRRLWVREFVFIHEGCHALDYNYSLWHRASYILDVNKKAASYTERVADACAALAIVRSGKMNRADAIHFAKAIATNRRKKEQDKDTHDTLFAIHAMESILRDRHHKEIESLSDRELLVLAHDAATLSVTMEEAGVYP